MTMQSPFVRSTEKKLVAIKGLRAGYLQIATPKEITHYAELPVELFDVARQWAAMLEEFGAKRIYWITLSEQVQHLHIHLYPRWNDEEAKGLDLFQQRDNLQQPPWSTELEEILRLWVEKFEVVMIS